MGASNAAQALEARLPGTWHLVGWTITDDGGGVQHPYGERPQGFLSYTPDGFMQVNICARGRAGLLESTADPAERRSRGFMTYFAYAGRWSVTGSTVIHHVQAALPQALVGTDQAREVTFEGAGLVLSAEAIGRTGRKARHRLTWERRP